MMLGTIITIAVAGGVGLVAGILLRGGMLRDELRSGRVSWADEWYTVTPEKPGAAEAPIKDPSAAKIISIVRAAIAAGHMDAELAHSEAERMRIARKAGL